MAYYFIELRRAAEDGSFLVVHRGEKSAGPRFKTRVSISGSKLNNGDNERTVEVRLMKWKKDGGHRLKSAFQTCGDKLKVRGTQWDIPERCVLAESRVTTKFTFLDYLNSGMEMNFVVAIDFTASNGHRLFNFLKFNYENASHSFDL